MCVATLDKMAAAQSTDRTELLGAVADVCHRVQRLLACYEEGREPDTLDCLVFHVERLDRILSAIGNISSEALEAVGVALSLLEELNRSCKRTESMWVRARFTS